MVIVGFAVAWAGKPAEPAEKTYTIQIQNVPHTAEVDNIRYNVFVGAVDDDMSITKKSNVVTITMPASIQTVLAASLVVFRSDRDNPKIFARCALTFDNGNGPDIKTKEIVPDAIFRLYLSPKYVAKVVHELIAVRHAIENEPCVEGVTTTAHGERKLLNGYFTLVPAGTESGRGNRTHISGAPPFAMMASAVAERLAADAFARRRRDFAAADDDTCWCRACFYRHRRDQVGGRFRETTRRPESRRPPSNQTHRLQLRLSTRKSTPILRDKISTAHSCTNIGIR